MLSSTERLDQRVHLKQRPAINLHGLVGNELAGEKKALPEPIVHIHAARVVTSWPDEGVGDAAKRRGQG